MMSFQSLCSWLPGVRDKNIIKERNERALSGKIVIMLLTVESEDHFLLCLVYIDLNMVRAGVTKHPSGWPFSGYHEIQSPQKKFALIAYQKLAEKAGFQSYELFKEAHGELVNEALMEGSQNSAGRVDREYCGGKRKVHSEDKREAWLLRQRPYDC